MDRTAPNCQLRLEWVYGFRGHKVKSNLHYNINNEIVYFVAGVGIVHNYGEHKQRFYLVHDDDIISLTMHSNKTLVASGQVGKEPQILVWNSTTMETVSILKGGHKDGYGVLAFDSTGDKLASCGIDQSYTIIVWDWKKAKILAKTIGRQAKVFDLKFNPYKQNSLIACGVNHITFFNLIGNTLDNKKKGIFGNNKNMQTMFTVEIGEEEVLEKDSRLVCYAGTLNGKIYTWKGTQLEHIIDAHTGSIFSIIKNSEGYLTGGRDGNIKKWDSKFTLLLEINLQDIFSTQKLPQYSGCDEKFVVRSLFCHESKVLIGSESSEVFEFDLNSYKLNCVVKGHGEGELWALAVSPVNPNIFATASDDQTVRIWDTKTNSIIKITELKKKIRSCDFNSDQTHLACGLVDGILVILNLE